MPSRTKAIKHETAAALATMIWLICGVTQASAQAVEGRSAKQLVQRAEQNASLTPESVEKMVEVIDDDLESVATLTTERAFSFNGGFTGRVRADNFFRAVIGKKTGATVFQLYARLRYSGELRRFATANYDEGGSPASTPLILTDRRFECPYGVCGGIEDVAFVVPEATMRALAARAGERPVRPWRYRLKAENAQDWTDDIAPTEAAGLLLAVDHYRRDHKLP